MSTWPSLPSPLQLEQTIWARSLRAALARSVAPGFLMNPAPSHSGQLENSKMQVLRRERKIEREREREQILRVLASKQNRESSAHERHGYGAGDKVRSSIGGHVADGGHDPR